MMLRLLFAGVAACLSVASGAAALFVPDTQGNWPRATHPFVDARSLQHDALAVGFAAAPGARPPSVDSVRFVVAPLAVPQFVRPASRPPGAAPAPDARAGGINALVRVDGVTADVGDVSTGGRYRPGDLAGDLRALPTLHPEGVDLRGDVAIDDETAPLGWAPRALVTVAALLLVTALLLAGSLLARDRPAR